MPDRREPGISTHVLDTERGEPAAGVTVRLARWDGEVLAPLAGAETDPDGRIASLAPAPLRVGRYQLSFDVAAYFLARGGPPPFLSRVSIDFEIADPRRHYHVPLLVSRFACSSYRGS